MKKFIFCAENRIANVACWPHELVPSLFLLCIESAKLLLVAQLVGQRCLHDGGLAVLLLHVQFEVRLLLALNLGLESPLDNSKRSHSHLLTLIQK